MNEQEAKELRPGDKVLLNGEVTSEGGMQMLQIGGVSISLRPELIAADEHTRERLEDYQEGDMIMLGQRRAINIVQYLSERIKIEADSLYAKQGFCNKATDFAYMQKKAEICVELLKMLRPLLDECEDAHKREEKHLANSKQKGGEA